MYLGGIGFVLLIIIVWIGFVVLYDAPTCFDGQQNGDETGVDCGGSCERICSFEATDPIVRWNRFFEVSPGVYNAVALVENPNTNAQARSVPYTFALRDADNILVFERTGQTDISPERLVPIFESDIVTGTRVPVRSTFTFDEPPAWERVLTERPEVMVTDPVLSRQDTLPRLDAHVRNDNVTPLSDVAFVAVLSGSDGNAVAASRTVVPYLAPGESQAIVFTWPQPLPKRIESCVAPADVMLLMDVSGSMNDDNQDPPQPLTDAIMAAGAFVERLDPTRDQSGLVSFATNAQLVQELTNIHAVTQRQVESLAIDPAEERGATNIGAAIERADEELHSVRHDTAARRAIVLLTDGRANEPEDPGGEPYALDRAAFAKDGGSTFYTIGLGDAVNTSFLTELAGASERTYLATNSTELDRIYQEIGAALCQRGPGVIDIIPKIPLSP